MLYHLFKYFDNVHNLPGAGMFQYISFRAAAAIIIAIMPCGALRDFSIFRALASSSGVISATRQMSSSVPKAGLASNRVTKVRAGFR